MSKQDLVEANDLIEQVLNSRAIPIAFDLKSICFPEQLRFIEDPAPWVTASCSRRSGKTEVCALDLLYTALQSPNMVCIYVTATRANAERIVWSKLLSLNDKYGLNGKANNSKLSITFPNKSVIYLSGCKDKSSLDNFRGMAIKLIYIDEVQSFRSFIEELVNDVLGPALADYQGKIKLIGTPAALKAGFFWTTLQSNEWSHHHWTFWENPFIAISSRSTHQEILDRELKRRGVNATHPSVRREWFGEWNNDTEALVLHWEYSKNNYTSIPELTDYIVGVDIGFNDADAIAVIGWHKNHKVAYLVEETVKPQQGITELVQQLEAVIKKYNPMRVVLDQGGLGKKIAEEMRKRYALPIVAAEKSRKLEFLSLLDDALRTSSFRSTVNSRFTKDSLVMEWDWDKSTADKLVIKDDPHSDIIDAVLYAYREALHWLSTPAKQKISPMNRDQWVKHSEELITQQIDKQAQRQQAEENEADFFATMEFEDPADVARYFINKKRS